MGSLIWTMSWELESLDTILIVMKRRRRKLALKVSKYYPRLVSYF
jgi:hypothetical protein